jgi:gas vesicle protein
MMEMMAHKNRYRHHDNSKKVVAAAVCGTTAGIAIGVIAGILLAPKSGKETREDIREMALKATEEARNTGGVVVTKMSEAFDVAKHSVGKLKEKIQREHEYMENACCCGTEAELAEELPTEITEENMKSSNAGTAAKPARVRKPGTTTKK